MANQQNIEPYKIKKGDLTHEEAARRGALGAKKRDENRKEREIVREALLRRLKATDLDEIADAWIQRAKKRQGAADSFADRIDGKPKERQEIDADITADLGLTLEEKRAAVAEKLENLFGK